MKFEEKYLHDPLIHNLVDYLVILLKSDKANIEDLTSSVYLAHKLHKEYKGKK